MQVVEDAYLNHASLFLTYGADRKISTKPIKKSNLFCIEDTGSNPVSSTNFYLHTPLYFYTGVFILNYFVMKRIMIILAIALVGLQSCGPWPYSRAWYYSGYHYYRTLPDGRNQYRWVGRHPRPDHYSQKINRSYEHRH